MNSALRLIILITLSSILSGCVTSQQRGSSGVVAMSVPEAELQAWNVWLNTHPLNTGKKMLLPEVCGDHWAFTKDGITERGKIPRDSGYSVMPGYYTMPTGPHYGSRYNPYTRTVRYKDATKIKSGGGGFIELMVQRPDGASTSYVTMPTSDRPAKTLISALLTVCPNVR